MTGIVLAAATMSPGGHDSGPLVSVTVNFETIAFERP
jgi:hypothetical protein